MTKINYNIYDLSSELATLIGFVCNILCVIVFKDFKSLIFKLLFYNSIADAFLLLTGLFYITSLQISFILKYDCLRYFAIISYFIWRVLSLSSNMISILIAYQRFMILNGKLLGNRKANILLITILIVSLLVYMPFLVRILMDEFNKDLSSASINFGDAMSSRIKRNEIQIKLTSLLHSTFTLVFLILMTIISIIMFKKLRAYWKTNAAYAQMIQLANRNTNRQSCLFNFNYSNPNSSRQNRITLMVFLISLIFILNQLFYIFMLIISFIFQTKIWNNAHNIKIFYSIHQSITAIFHSTNIFIYFFCDSIFSIKLKAFFKLVTKYF